MIANSAAKLCRSHAVHKWTLTFWTCNYYYYLVSVFLSCLQVGRQLQFNCANSDQCNKPGLKWCCSSCLNTDCNLHSLCSVQWVSQQVGTPVLSQGLWYYQQLRIEARVERLCCAYAFVEEREIINMTATLERVSLSLPPPPPLPPPGWSKKDNH